MMSDDGGRMRRDEETGLTAYDYSRDLEAVTTNDDGSTTHHYTGGLKLTLKSDAEIARIEAQREAEDRVRNARSWPKPVEVTVDALERRMDRDGKWEVFDKRRTRRSIIPPQTPTYVYMLRCHTRYKIGRTRNPKHRIQALKTMLPYESELVALGEFSDASGRESFFHALLKEGGKHRKGEWFELDEEDVHHLTNMICRGDTDRPLIDSLRMLDAKQTD